MKKQQFNIKGSRCDYSFHTQESDYARRMYNMRIVTDKQAGTYVLENEQGTIQCTCTQKPNVTSYPSTNSGFPEKSSYTLIGCYYVQNKLYLFFAKNNRTGTPKDLIFEVTISDTTYNIKTLVEEDLNFDKEHPLQIVSYYESEVLHKLYFIDGKNFLTSVKINEYNGVYKINTLSSINSQLQDISFEVNVDDGGGVFKPSIRSYGCVFLDAYGITTNCILDNIKYEIANTDGKSNAPDTTINKVITVKVYFNQTIKDSYEYIKLYSFSRESYQGETIIQSVYKSNQNINLKTAQQVGDKYFVTFTDFNNGEAETINNIQLSSLNITSSAICTNGEYLLLGNNKYSSTSAVEKIVNLDKNMIKISFAQTKEVIVSNSNTSNLNYEGFCAEPQTILNNTKYYFKSGEQYRLGYQLYYDSGNVSDIIPLAYNSQGFTVKIPSYENTKVVLKNDKYYTNKYIIYVKLLSSALNLLKAANVVGIKFYFLQNEQAEKRIVAQCAFLPAVQMYTTNMLNIQGVQWDVVNTEGACVAPMIFFRPGYTKDFNIQYNFNQEMDDVSSSFKSYLNDSNASLKYKTRPPELTTCSLQYSQISDYPYLLSGSTTNYTNRSNNGFGYQLINDFADYYIMRLSPNVGELISADLDMSDISSINLSDLQLCYSGSLSHAVCAYNNTTTKSNVPLYKQNSAQYSYYGWQYPGNTGTSDNNLEDYFCYQPINSMWWAQIRGSTDHKAFVINKFLYPSLLNSLLDINVCFMHSSLNQPVLKVMNATQEGYTYRNPNNLYPSYKGKNLNWNQIISRDGLASDHPYFCGYQFGETTSTMKRTLTSTWTIPRKQKSILCYFPTNKDITASNISGYIGPYAWLKLDGDSTTPIIELVQKKILYNANNQNWVEAQSVPVYNLNYSVKSIKNGQSFKLDIGDTTISQYLYEVANVNGNDNFTAKVSSMHGDIVTDAQIMSYKSQDPKTNPCSVNSYVICPLETQLSLYYENFNLSTLLNKSWDFKEAGEAKINNVFNDRRSFLQFQQYNEAEIKGTEMKNEIIALGPKQPNELNDKWLNLSTNNIQTYYLNGEYGAINSLKSIDNGIYAFTDKAIFKVGFNQTSSLPSSTQYLQMARNPSFTGDYIIGEVGCNDNEKVLQTTNGLYLLSNTHKELYSIQGDKVSAMGLMKFNKSALQYFNYDKWNPYTNIGAILRYNAHYNELYIIDGGDSSNTPIERCDDLKFGNEYYNEAAKCLTYSEMLGEFTSYYDYWYAPYWFFIGNTQYSIAEDNKIYQMHTGNYSQFYKYTYFKDFTPITVSLCSQVSFTIVHNQEIDKNKILYSISYSGGLYNTKTPIDQQYSIDAINAKKLGININAEGFQVSAIEKLYIYNDYQNTGVINVQENGLNAKINPYIPQYSKHKLQTWNILVPRDALKGIGASKYKNQRIQNVWNEIVIGLPFSNDDYYGNKAAKIWNLTLNYN